MFGFEAFLICCYLKLCLTNKKTYRPVMSYRVLRNFRDSNRKSNYKIRCFYLKYAQIYYKFTMWYEKFEFEKVEKLYTICNYITQLQSFGSLVSNHLDCEIHISCNTLWMNFYVFPSHFCNNKNIPFFFLFKSIWSVLKLVLVCVCFWIFIFYASSNITHVSYYVFSHAVCFIFGVSWTHCIGISMDRYDLWIQDLIFLKQISFLNLSSIYLILISFT